jgi:hypothetical protein
MIVTLKDTRCPVCEVRRTAKRITVTNPFPHHHLYLRYGIFVGPNQDELTFTLRKNGKWILKGMLMEGSLELEGVS